MLWGSINEEKALVTYLKTSLTKSEDNYTVRETGIWFSNDENNRSWLGSSRDGTIEENGKGKTVLEIKCPFMGGKPVPYKNVCVSTRSLKLIGNVLYTNATMSPCFFGPLLAPKFSLLRGMIVISNFF